MPGLLIEDGKVVRRISLAAVGGGPANPDNCAALRTAVAVLREQGGGMIEIGPGTHRFASETLSQRGIALPNDITIQGAGAQATILQVTGSAPCNLFVGMNCSRIGFEALTLTGNNVAGRGSSSGSGAAIRWGLTKTATTGIVGLTMRQVHLENFRGPYWVDIENAAAAERGLAISRIVIEHVTFVSRPGNSIAPGDVRFNAAVISINGYSGEISDVRVSELSGDARHIKTGIILYHQISNAVLHKVHIRHAGRSGAGDDGGGYAIQLYDSFYRMTDVRVLDPVIEAPRSVGLYVAGGTGIAVINPVVSGQTDRLAGTLPKGAIVFNGTRKWRLAGGRLRDNWRDLDIVAGPGTIAGQVVGVQASGSTTGLSIRYAAGYVASGIVVRDCRWKTVQTTVSVQNSVAAIAAGPPVRGGRVDDIVFVGCQFEAAAGFRAMDLWVDSGSVANGYVISGCTLIGSNPLYARSHGGSLRVTGCTIRDLGTSAGAAAATLIDCPKLDLSDCLLVSPGPGGIGIDLGGSMGSVRRLRFSNTARYQPAAPTPVQLGSVIPNFAGKKGQFVQNLRADMGNVEGWVCVGDLSWKVVI